MSQGSEEAPGLLKVGEFVLIFFKNQFHKKKVICIFFSVKSKVCFYFLFRSAMESVAVLDGTPNLHGQRSKAKNL